MITIPFYELIDRDSEIWQIINKDRYPSLYPPNTLPDEIIENINSYFYDRQIAYSSPEKFLMQWWRLTRERSYTWQKLLMTEKVLRDDDMLFNYDLTEDSTDNRTSIGTNDSTTTPNIKTVTTPDIMTSQSTQNNQQTIINQSGSEKAAHDQTIHEMDTPDGMTDDISNYLTRAQKDNTNDQTENDNYSRQHNITDDLAINRQTGQTTQKRTGSENITTSIQSKDDNVHHLTRKGNIGTMTVASVLGGFREAQLYDVYSSVIFPECENLFLHFVDLDEIDIW